MPSKIITLSANTSWYLYNFRSSTIKEFIGMGYQVICIAPEDNFSHKLESLGCQWIALEMDNKGTNPLKDVFICLKLFRLYKKIKPFVVFHFTIKNNIYGTWAASILNIPSINNITGLGTAFLKQNFISLVVKGLYKSSQPLAHKIFCQNKEDYFFLINKNLIPENKLFLLPGSGVNLQRFNPSLRKLYNEKDNQFKLLFCGRMLADKGLFELIKSLEEVNLHEIKCRLRLQGFIDNKNISAISDAQISQWSRLEWVDWKGPTDAIEEVMSLVDGVVLPSYREGMPRTLLEACAMGLPVIATNVPGCNDIVKDGINGFLCEPKNSDSLRDAILKLLDMPYEERINMGKKGREQVKEKFDEKYVVQAAVSSVLEVSNS